MNNAWKSVLLPITRNELPGWGKVLRAIGRTDYRYDYLWANAPTKVIRGKEHGYLMELDLTNWSARATYFLGRYYELHILRLLDMILSPGDRFIDIGANIGMITLHAAHCVGSNGSVECFEPNPQCREQLERVIELNGIRHIKIHPCGLSDEPALLELKQNHTHSGVGTFADMDPGEVVAYTSAEVRCGDDVYADDEGPKPRLIKVDIEGFELRAMLGIEHTLRRWRTPVIMETNEDHLIRAGASLEGIHELMRSMEYSPLRIGIQRRHLRYRLDLTPVHGVSGLRTCRDVLWTTTPSDPFI